MWLDVVKEQYGSDLNIHWRNFSLEQNALDNSPSPSNTEKVWEMEDLKSTRSVLAAVAGEAARKQGPDAFNAFFVNLLKERHGPNRVPLNDNNKFIEIADRSSLDVVAFQHDLEDSSLLKIISGDHMEATQKYGIFGTPTFVFSNGHSAYLKMFVPPNSEAVETFEHFIDLFENRKYIGEIKRPQPPWPKGAV